jgi:hypothetical protein
VKLSWASFEWPNLSGNTPVLADKMLRSAENLQTVHMASARRFRMIRVDSKADLDVMACRIGGEGGGNLV